MSDLFGDRVKMGARETAAPVLFGHPMTNNDWDAIGIPVMTASEELDHGTYIYRLKAMVAMEPDEFLEFTEMCVQAYGKTVGTKSVSVNSPMTEPPFCIDINPAPMPPLKSENIQGPTVPISVVIEDIRDVLKDSKASGTSAKTLAFKFSNLADAYEDDAGKND